MKILKHGKCYQKRTCVYCKCKFAYITKEVNTILWKFVVCPECGEKNYID